jgi:hypothetical protein
MKYELLKEKQDIRVAALNGIFPVLNKLLDQSVVTLSIRKKEQYRYYSFVFIQNVCCTFQSQYLVAKKMKANAHKTYIKYMQKNGHPGLETIEAGFVVHHEKCLLGASPRCLGYCSISRH